MTLPLVLGPEEALLSRRALTGADGNEEDAAAQDARRIVRSATATLELSVENAERGRTVDGWLTDDGLVWHVRGDLDTPRTTVVTPPAHLGATVAAMVALGERRAPGADVQVPVAALRAQLADPRLSEPRHDGLPGGVVRVWSLQWAGERTGRMTVVDQGPGGGLFLVGLVRGEDVDLHPVTALEVWTRLCGLPAIVRGERPGG